MKTVRPYRNSLSVNVMDVPGRACAQTPLCARIATRSRVRVPAWQSTTCGVGVPADQHQPPDHDRTRDVEHGPAGNAHHHGARVTERGQFDLAPDGEPFLVVAGSDLHPRGPAPRGRGAQRGPDVGVGATTSLRRDHVPLDHARVPRSARP